MLLLRQGQWLRQIIISSRSFHGRHVAQCRHKQSFSSLKASIAPATPVDTAVEVAVAAAGRQPGPADLELANRLKDNWYHTAADVAAMSQDELDMMRVPVKLWAVIKEQLYTTVGADTAADEQQQQETLPEGQLAESASQPAEQTSGTSAVEVVPLPADIMQRRMPATARRGRLLTAAAPDGFVAAEAQRKVKPVAVRHAKLKSTQAYGLQEAEFTDALRAEFNELERFSTTRFYGQLVEPLQPITYHSVTKHYAKLLLGYAARVKGVPLDQLSLRSLLPSPGREGVSLLMEYQHWRQAERGTAASTANNPIKAVIHIARFLYHDLAKPPPDRRVWPYHDLEVVQELTRMQRAAMKAAVAAPRVADESKKWLEWDDYLAMVRALRAECAGLTSAGAPRKPRDVAESLQRYLIVAILSVVPDRQRTLRELELGRTLLQRDDGSWIIKHGSADYKTGKKYGDRPPLVIAPFIYPELEAFIHTWRQELAPKTNKLFCKPRTGQEMDENAVYYMFRNSSVRLTGKATHPHLVRDMIVTHLRTQKTGEAQMEALALYMGHSMEMQRSSYDRRSKAQRITPAVDLLQSLHRS